MKLNETFSNKKEDPMPFANSSQNGAACDKFPEDLMRNESEIIRYEQRFCVEFSYDVIHTHHLFSPKNKTIDSLIGTSDHRGIVFVDSNVADAFPDLLSEIENWFKEHAAVLKKAPAVYKVIGGEIAKNSFFYINAIIQQMLDEKICRHSFVFIVGGGAVIDAVSFAASIFHRGIRQIRIPTTVLSQDDSAVGVKNGVNHLHIKNLLGVFYPPHAVIIDGRFLETLSKRDIAAGLSEAFKVALIKDASLFSLLRKECDKIRSRDMNVLMKVIEMSAKIHARHIQNGGDPFERGSSRPLDFGHWSAHKLESITRHELLHGEAVSIGMCIDLFCSANLGLISLALVFEIIDTFVSCGLLIWDDRIKTREPSGDLSILKGLEEFREHLGGKLTLAMPVEIGKTLDIHELSPSVVLTSIRQLEEYKNRK